MLSQAHYIGELQDSFDEDEDSWSHKLCDCCYRQWFGHEDVEIKNCRRDEYPQIRERLRLKLEQKNKDHKSDTSSVERCPTVCTGRSESVKQAPPPPPVVVESGDKMKSVDEILEFINGPDPNKQHTNDNCEYHQSTTKQAKKMRQKQKKAEERLLKQQKEEERRKEMEKKRELEMKRAAALEEEKELARIQHQELARIQKEKAKKNLEKQKKAEEKLLKQQKEEEKRKEMEKKRAAALEEEKELARIQKERAKKNLENSVLKETPTTPKKKGAKEKQPEKEVCVKVAEKSRSKLSIEEVFKPREDLDCLDEVDRDVENFKRSVFGCQPRQNKAKVQLNLNLSDFLKHVKKPLETVAKVDFR